MAARPRWHPNGDASHRWHLSTWPRGEPDPDGTSSKGVSDDSKGSSLVGAADDASDIGDEAEDDCDPTQSPSPSANSRGTGAFGNLETFNSFKALSVAFASNFILFADVPNNK